MRIDQPTGAAAFRSHRTLLHRIWLAVAGIALTAMVPTQPLFAHESGVDLIAKNQARFFIHSDHEVPLRDATITIVNPADHTTTPAGKTDQDGEFDLPPLPPGRWEIRAYSQAGHGIAYFVIVRADGSIVLEDQPHSRFSKQNIALMMALLWGLFTTMILLTKGGKTMSTEDHQH